MGRIVCLAVLIFSDTDGNSLLTTVNGVECHYTCFQHKNNYDYSRIVIVLWINSETCNRHSCA